jgi:hypothetical protein
MSLDQGQTFSYFGLFRSREHCALWPLVNAGRGSEWQTPDVRQSGSLAGKSGLVAERRRHGAGNGGRKGGHNDQKPRAAPRSRLAVLVQVDRDGTQVWGSAAVEHCGPSCGSGADKRSRQYRRRFSYETGPVNFAPLAARHFITFSWRDATSQLGESSVEVPVVEVFTLGRRCLP